MGKRQYFLLLLLFLALSYSVDWNGYLIAPLLVVHQLFLTIRKRGNGYRLSLQIASVTALSVAGYLLHAMILYPNVIQHMLSQFLWRTGTTDQVSWQAMYRTVTTRLAYLYFPRVLYVLPVYALTVGIRIFLRSSSVSSSLALDNAAYVVRCLQKSHYRTIDTVIILSFTQGLLHNLIFRQAFEIHDYYLAVYLPAFALMLASILFDLWLLAQYMTRKHCIPGMLAQAAVLCVCLALGALQFMFLQRKADDYYENHNFQYPLVRFADYVNRVTTPETRIYVSHHIEPTTIQFHGALLRDYQHCSPTTPIPRDTHTVIAIKKGELLNYWDLLEFYSLYHFDDYILLQNTSEIPKIYFEAAGKNSAFHDYVYSPKYSTVFSFLEAPQSARTIVEAHTRLSPAMHVASFDFSQPIGFEHTFRAWKGSVDSNGVIRVPELSDTPLYHISSSEGADTEFEVLVMVKPLTPYKAVAIVDNSRVEPPVGPAIGQMFIQELDWDGGYHPGHVVAEVKEMTIEPLADYPPFQKQEVVFFTSKSTRKLRISLPLAAAWNMRKGTVYYDRFALYDLTQ